MDEEEVKITFDDPKLYYGPEAKDKFWSLYK
jgi:hypothetical protein